MGCERAKHGLEIALSIHGVPKDSINIKSFFMQHF